MKESDSFGCCVEYDSQKQGHYIEDVVPHSPAERAGLKVCFRLSKVLSTPNAGLENKN